MAKKQRMYTPEFRKQMVELVRAGREYANLEKEFGCNGWSIRQWVKQADRDSGRGDGGLTWSGFLYLAVVLEVWSRRIVGWAMESPLRTEEGDPSFRPGLPVHQLCIR